MIANSEKEKKNEGQMEENVIFRVNKKLCKRESISTLNQKIGKMYLFIFIFLVDMIEFEYMELVSQ